MSRNKKIYGELINEISWDNWEDEKGGHFDLCEVLNNKLNWLLEDVTMEDWENSEHFDTIKQVQKLLSILNEKKIEKVI